MEVSHQGLERSAAELSGAPPPCPAGWTIGPPDFVGVGAQKAGTTWWYELITAHPDVAVPDGLPKELHFFSRFWNESVSDANHAEYHHFFPRPAGKIVGEWTPYYMYDSWTPRFLAAAAPDARILVMLRDPVDRYRSDVVHYISVGEDGRRIAGYQIAHGAHCRGLYAIHLRQLLRHFAAEQVLILQYERCRKDPASQLRRTYDFLGLAPDFVPTDIDARRNPAAFELELAPEFEADLAATFAEELNALEELVPDLDPGLWPSTRGLVR